MKKQKRFEYTDYPLGNVEIIEDFLPPPEQLVLKEKTTKITIALDESCLNFFKKEAKRNHTPYQKMIRNLLNHYVAVHKNKLRQ